MHDVFQKTLQNQRTKFLTPLEEVFSMALTSITSATAPTIPTAATSTSASAASSTGISSTGSSLTSASSTSAAASPGFCGQISNVISQAVEWVRSMLAKLPLIGSWFERSAASSATTPGTTSGTASTTTAVDNAQILNMIKATFIQPAPAVSHTVPAADVVTQQIARFDQITAEPVKVEAFAAIVNALNSSDAITTQFYNRLTAAQQEAFKYKIFQANGNSSVYPAGSVDHGIGFGNFMIANHLGADVVKTAARNYAASLTPASSTSSTATSTTGTSSTTTTP